MAEIPRSAVDEAVMTQQLSVQRYATAPPGPAPAACCGPATRATGGDDLDAIEADDDECSAAAPDPKARTAPAAAAAG